MKRPKNDCQSGSARRQLPRFKPTYEMAGQVSFSDLETLWKVPNAESGDNINQQERKEQAK